LKSLSCFAYPRKLLSNVCRGNSDSARRLEMSHFSDDRVNFAAEAIKMFAWYASFLSDLVDNIAGGSFAVLHSSSSARDGYDDLAR
jgi:hypothetical protein